MVSLGFSPSWFFHHSIAFELIFAVITLFVAIYSYKIYKLSKERSAQLFSLAFLAFSFSYFIQSILNIGILYKLSENIQVFQKVSESVNLGLNALFVHMLFIITGLIILTTIFFKAKRIKLFLLLLAISIIPIYLGKEPLNIFFILSTIYLVFITLHYLKNYFKKGTTSKFIVFTAFLLLFLSNISYILSTQQTIYYVVAHFLELFTYILLLINLILVSKK